MAMTAMSPVVMVPTEVNDLSVWRKSFRSDVTWYVIYLGYSDLTVH